MKIIKALIIALLTGFAFSCLGEDLLAGNHLVAWDSWITMQPPTNEFLYKPEKIRGLNHDDKKVFTVEKGVLRVSGEEWGALISKKEYENFHLSFDMKWGEKKWFPRETIKRDSGVLYFSGGPLGGSGGYFMRSHEFQIQEGDCGDYYSIDGVMVDAPVTDTHDGDWKFYIYNPQVLLREQLKNRIVKQGDFEKPLGEWNHMEIITDGETIIHKVNGHEVLRLHHSQILLDGKLQALLKGKIQIQSEGAEVFYRNFAIVPLKKPAASY